MSGRNQMPQLVVKSHRPWQFALAVIFLSAFAAVVTWLLLDYAHWSVIQDRARLNEDYTQLRGVNRDLEQENQRLREKVLALEQTTRLDKQTASLLQNELAALQDEIHRLKGELEFYQGIMESTRDTEGLNIYGVHVRPLSMERSFMLRLVLTHVVKGDKVAQGRLEVLIEGVDKEGAVRRFSLNELSIDEMPPLEFEFKNFKRFERNLTLPSGFEPLRIFVQILPRSGKQAVISKVFEWPATAS